MGKTTWVLAAALWLLPLASVLGQESEVEEVDSKIVSVTVFSDRAEVHREAAVSLSDGLYSFGKLPGWVDEGSVRVALVPADAGTIEDVRVNRTFLARTDDAKVLKAQEAVLEIQDELEALNDELRILENQAKHIAEIKAFSLEKVSRDSPTREMKVESFDAMVKYVSTSLREISKSRREIELKRRKLAPELLARQRNLGEIQKLTRLEETSVVVSIRGNGRARLELTYMLPGATWEPAHELRANLNDDSSVELTSFAVVSQTSGEDWTNATVTFSTQSSTESLRIPELTSLTLGDSGVQPKAFQERAASFDRARNAFEGQNRLWNEVNPNKQKAVMAEIYDNNFGNMYAVQTKTAAIFEQMRTRGTSASFGGSGKSTIRADGYPVRVTIGKVKLAAQQAIVAVPELSLNSVRTARMTNTGTLPLLPGGVALFRDGAFLGMTEIGFVAEGESFAVFMGVADQVKLSRVLDRKFSTIERNKTTTIMKVAYDVTVENLSGSDLVVDLTERIPISDNKAIEVDKIEVSGKKEPDSRGLVKWNVPLKAKESKKFRIQYRVEYPTAVMKEMRRAKSSSAKMKVQMRIDTNEQQKVYDFEDDQMDGESNAPAQLMQIEDIL